MTKQKIYKNPALTADIIIEDPRKGIILIQRKFPPFQGQWALPGGFVEYGETVEHAAVREAKEETGLRVKLKKLLGVYSDPKRDPRGHTVTVVFTAKVLSGRLRGSDDANHAEWMKQIPFNALAFDHADVLRDYKKMKKRR